MSEGGEQPPLDQRKRREGGRTGIPRSTTRRDSTMPPPPPEAIRSRSSSRIRVKRMTKSSEATLPRENEDANFATSVVVSTPGAEVAKRPRPEDSSPDSPAQGDGRHPKKYLALPQPPSPPSTYNPPSPSSLTPQPPLPPLQLHKTYVAKTKRDPSDSSLSQPLVQSPQPENKELQIQTGSSLIESASWPRDSTSYVDLASPVEVMATSRPQSPQPGPSGCSYAAAAATPLSPRSQPVPPNVVPPTTSRSSYPPITVERLPNWTRHFDNLNKIIGHAPNARPLGKGVRFLPGSAEEFRAVQKYLTDAANQDPTISWFCYSPASDLPTKIAIRGLPLDTPPDEVVAALQDKGFPASKVKAIPPTKGRHGCVYFVLLDHMNQEELGQLYQTTELLSMPGLIIEAWRRGRAPPQCHRCQAFGHASVNCHRPVRCVRCAGEHLARDCTRPREDPPTCANCAKAQTARDRRCTLFKKEARKRGITLAPPRPNAPQSRPTRQQGSAPRPTSAPVVDPNTPQPTHRARENQAPSAAEQQPTTTTNIATGPTTLNPPANPASERGRPAGLKKKKKKKRKRETRPIHTEPAAASTPHPRQQVVTESQPTTNRPPSSASEARLPSMLPQQAAVPSMDMQLIVQVITEALMAALAAYTQGQGIIPAISAAIASLARLHSH